MAGKGNRLKNEVKEKKPRKSSGGPSLLSRIRESLSVFGDQRLVRITGLLLILFSVYLLIALSSHLFTWKTDQDKMALPLGTYLTDTTVTVDNWLGKIGALLSHTFMQGWFGLPAFAFVLLFFVSGVRILLKISLLPLGKTFRYSFFGLLWLSPALDYIFRDSEFSPGGAFGHVINQHLTGLLGFAGTGFLLVFTFLAFLVMAFDFSFIPKPKEIPVTEEGTEPEAPLTNELIPENISQPIDLNDEARPEETEEEEPRPEEQPQEETIIPEPVAEPAVPVLDLELPEAPAEEEKSEEEGVQLAIEAPKEEAIAENTEGMEFPQGEFDPTLELSSYQFPHLDLLENYGTAKIAVDRDELEQNKNRIVETLGHYNIGIDKIKATIGPTVTLYEIIPNAGVRISRIKKLEDDIALSLSALGIRIIAPIPGKGTIGIEVPNQKPEIVSMRSVLASEKFQNSEMELPVAIGKTISNEVFITDLAKMPHLLMAGATGQGKSVGLNTLLVSLLYKKHPSQVKFVLIDPKKVELTLYKTIERHFLAKLPNEEEAIINDTKKVIYTLNSLCIEMDQRYDLLKEAGVRNIKEYNAKFVARRLNPQKGHRFLPYIVLVIDEFADLIMTAGKEVESPITRLAQLARAIGIHLIIATQRPSVNIITGTIKANFPSRIAFRVTSKIDSRTILDAGGADQLIGRGDMLYSSGADLIRLQCAFVDTPEVEKITEFIGAQRGYPSAHMLPEYTADDAEGGGEAFDASERDAMFEEAARIVVQHQQGSASLLQRKLKLGYNRAGRIVDQLESAGVIGPFEGSKAREVLIKDPVSLEQFLNNLKSNQNPQ